MQPYNGERPVFHTIEYGETLSGIAQAYRFEDWKPIHRFNTEVHPILTADENRIPAGERIWIPRSPGGYDRLISKLIQLEIESTGQMDRIRYELDREHDLHQAQRVLFDFTGDVATLLATTAFRAVKAANMAKVAAGTVGQSRAAAHYLAHKAADELSSDLRGKLLDEAIGFGLGKIEPRLSGLYEDGVVPARDGLKTIRNFSLQGGRSLLEVADIVLDQLSVSKLADVMVRVVAGETPEETYRSMSGGIRDAQRRTSLMLTQKIGRYQREQAVVYGPR